jgi:hypothetical protein
MIVFWGWPSVFPVPLAMVFHLLTKSVSADAKYFFDLLTLPKNIITIRGNKINSD